MIQSTLDGLLGKGYLTLPFRGINVGIADAMSSENPILNNDFLEVQLEGTVQYITIEVQYITISISPWEMMSLHLQASATNIYKLRILCTNKYISPWEMILRVISCKLNSTQSH